MTLTFQHLQTNGEIPANSFALLEGKLYLDIGTLIQEPVSNLNAAKVVEMALKLLMACNKAQEQYNLTAQVGQRLNCFPAPISGTNQAYPNMSGYYATLQCTAIGLVPADINNVVAVFQ